MEKPRKIEIRKILSIIFCLISAVFFGQNNEMQFNNNRIDSEVSKTNKIYSKFKKNKEDKSKIQIIAEVKNDSLFSIYIKNNSKDTLKLQTQDWHSYIIQEAKDNNGNWKPIEYWSYSDCGNSYGSEKMEPEKIIKTESEKYSGDFKTKIRFKLNQNDEIYYSNQIDCNINLSKFEISTELKENYLYKNALKIADEKLAQKIMFLEPNAMEEFSKKNKEWRLKLSELRKKNNKNSN